MTRARILIVDDDEVVRESLHDELVGEYEVETAAGGREALDRLTRSVYDVVISDLRMPEVNGVEVLERVRGLQPDAVRILLTGFLDEEARVATLREDAPFKIGKPWHGTIEVTLKRALEHREATRRLAAQMHELGAFDEELAHAHGVVGLAGVLVERLARAEGIVGAAVTTDVAGVRRDLVRVPGPAAGQVPAWSVDEVLAPDSGVHLEVGGRGVGTRAFVQALAARARRWFADAPAVRLATAASASDRARHQLMALARRADVGAMSTSVMHELASLLQHFTILADDLRPFEAAHPGSDVAESLRGVREASDRILSLFRHLRSFVSGAEPRLGRLRLARVVDQATALCRSFARTRSLVVEWVGLSPDTTEVAGDPMLLTQVLVNLIRNAVDATSDEGTIVVSVSRAPSGAIVLAVTDDGAGVPASVRDHLFEPFATSKNAASGSGLGLALSAMIMREHGGTLVHLAPASGGARFEARFAVVSPA